MWNQLFDRLNNSEKEELKKLINYLLSHTFIVRDIYDVKEGMMKVNPDYRFVERNFDIFFEYLSFSGWVIQKDSNYGVVYLESSYEYNRVRLERTTTVILYILRLIYEEERAKVSLRNEILTTTGQIVQKMITLGLVKKKPSDRELIESLRQISTYQIIQRISGAWEEAETKLIILPSILFVVSNEKISRMYEMMELEEESTPEEEAALTYAVIRGDEDTL